MKINTNIAAVLASHNLNRTEDKLSASLERLSSGYRINKAADDAAGMAISQKMHAQIRGLERASRNGSDGISFIQTAEGALSEAENILQRCRELSVQAASTATTTIEDREAIQEEIDALISELDRISSDTEYNTKTILDGSCARSSTSDNIGVSVVSMTDDVEKTTYSFTITQAAQKPKYTSGGVGMAASDTFDEEGTIVVNGEAIKIEKGETMESAYSKIRDICEKMNIDVKPSGDVSPANMTAGTQLEFESVLYGGSHMVEVTGSGYVANMLGLDGGTTFPSDPQEADAKVSLDTSADSGFTTTATAFTDGGRVTVSDRNGFNMIFDVSGASAGDTANVMVLDAGYVPVQIGANEGQTVDISIPPITAAALDVQYCNVCSGEGAQAAIKKFDEAISQISSIRAKLGAYENRLDSATASLDETGINLTEACSRIEDADMADEMTDYTNLSVLSQAGTSMLAQANNRPQTILQLLQG